MKSLSLEEKRELARKLLLQKQQATTTTSAPTSPKGPGYQDFMGGTDTALSEVQAFNEWAQASQLNQGFAWEPARLGAANPEVVFRDRESQSTLNLGTYNYLGLGAHPDVIAAGCEALHTYGLGCGASPNAHGKLLIHEQLEQGLVDYFGRPEDGVSLFSAGYNVNTGTISALMSPGTHVVLDSSVHMSIVEGARLSGASVHTFTHNDPADLKRVLTTIADGKTRVLVCLEGVYSADGDFGRLSELTGVAKRFGAMVLVDEAHSVLLCGPHGRGVAAQQEVLDQIDLLVITFSKGFGGIGGAMIAHNSIARYVNWYARSRLFSCAISPAVTAGVLKSLEIARGPDGDARRARLMENANHLREGLQGKVRLGDSQSWIVPVIYGSEQSTVKVCAQIQAEGLSGSVMEFPAVPQGAARLRLFVSSEHTAEQLDRAIDIILRAADDFGFRS